MKTNAYDSHIRLFKAGAAAAVAAAAVAAAAAAPRQQLVTVEDGVPAVHHRWVVIAAIPAAALFCLTSRPDLATLIFTECGYKTFETTCEWGLMYISIIFVPK